MAIAIGSAPDEVSLRIQFKDVDGEEVIKVVSLDGAMTDADIVVLMTSLDALTNAGVLKASVVTSRPITGFSAASSAAQNTIGYIMALTFEKANPLNANKTVRKSFIVPAPPDALKDTDKKPVEGNTALDDIISGLEDWLNYLGVDGTYYPGGWTYNRSASGFGTVNNEIDGF